MNLYIQVKIDEQLVEFTTTLMAASKASRIVYMLYPTTIFLEDSEIVCDSMEEDKNGVRSICYYNKTDDFYSSAKVLSLEQIDWKFAL